MTRCLILFSQEVNMKKTEPKTQSPKIKTPEVADIFMRYGKAFRSRHKLTRQQHRIMEDITFCRTLGMGEHHLNCDHCDHMDISYNSCRNRHCPKCGALNKARWLEARTSDLLPVSYAHGVFTLPHDLNPLIMYNKKLILNALFRTVNATLKAFAQNDQYRHGLKGDLGYTTVLHTWNQKLFPHFHLHCIIPSGVYRPNEERWIPTKYRFLFPVKALSEVFKGKMVSFLRRAYKSGLLVFPKRIIHLQQKETFSGLLSTLMDKNWVVYCKTPFKSPKFVLDYLGRYTHRVAISNNRIVSMDKGNIRFTFKNRDKSYQTEICCLESDVFIRRFLCHELPSGFMRIRHYGFMGSAVKRQRLSAIRECLDVKPSAKSRQEKTDVELMKECTGIDITLCPNCQIGHLKRISAFDGIYANSLNRHFYRKAG